MLESVLTSPLWLDGQEISPGVHVVSGPISLTKAQTHVPIVSPKLTDFSSFTGPFNYQKSRPSQPMPEPEPVHTDTVLSAEYVDTILSSVMFLTSLPPTRSMLGSLYTYHCISSLHATLGNIRAQTSADSEIFQQAATHTASKLVDMWYHFPQQIPVNANDPAYNPGFIITLIFPQESLLMLLQL